MKASIRDLFPRFYTPEQVEPCIRYIGHLDRMLVDDGTYYVEADETGLIACGGWSRRYKLYAGSGSADDDDRLLDPATEAARVRAMFVRGDRTRRGLGTRILETCEAAAKWPVPSRSIRRRPWRSPSAPPSRSSAESGRR